jgi:hypothetical protein
MSTDNKAIQVLERKLQLEIVVPAEPRDLTEQVLQSLNAHEGRFVAKVIGVSKDGSHIQVKTRIRDQGVIQTILEDLAHELNLSFRDSTQTDNTS